MTNLEKSIDEALEMVAANETTIHRATEDIEAELHRRMLDVVAEHDTPSELDKAGLSMLAQSTARGIVDGLGKGFGKLPAVPRHVVAGMLGLADQRAHLVQHAMKLLRPEIELRVMRRKRARSDSPMLTPLEGSYPARDGGMVSGTLPQLVQTASPGTAGQAAERKADPAPLGIEYGLGTRYDGSLSGPLSKYPAKPSRKGRR
jgi:hypothetical protein